LQHALKQLLAIVACGHLASTAGVNIDCVVSRRSCCFSQGSHREVFDVDLHILLTVSPRYQWLK